MRQLDHPADCDCSACYMWSYRRLDKRGHREKLNQGNARHQATWRQRHPGTESLRKKAYKAADQVMDFLLKAAFIGKNAEVQTQFLTFFESHRRDLLRFFWEGLHYSISTPLLCEPIFSMAALYFRDANTGTQYTVGFHADQNRHTLFKRRFGILSQTNSCGYKGCQFTFASTSFELKQTPTLTIIFETELLSGSVFIRIEEN
jgi:hypothetical protein